MATKAENRATLKRLQLIVHMRGDDEVPKVIEELREAIHDAVPQKRKLLGGRDRVERGGRDREE